jgi:hypothetical protein
MKETVGKINTEPEIENAITGQKIRPLRVLPPAPGCVSIILSDGNCFASQDIPEELLEDTAALSVYLSHCFFQLREALYNVRRDYERLVREGEL